MSERLGDQAEVVLLTFTTPDRLDDYQHRRSLPLPVLIDADRSVYAAYGLGRGTLGAVWGWDTIRSYARILFSPDASTGASTGVRHRLKQLRAPTEDTRQLGGDFVIAPDGTLTWFHRSTGPADRPAPDTITAAVERCTP